MSEIEGIYAVWLRELKVFIREKERVIASLVSPLLWIFAFGMGFGSVLTIEGVNYMIYSYPGILVMTVLFPSLFYGLYVIWDRRLDFLKEVLVAPVSRVSVFIGKVLGGCTTVMIQAIAIMIIGFFIGVPMSLVVFVEVFLLLFLISIALVSLGLSIGANMKSPEGFTLVANFVMWPLFLFSGALVPLSDLPSWLLGVTNINPITYGVDAVRGTAIEVQHFPLLGDIGVLLLFSLVVIAIGALSFRRMHD
jgi:ABC-2 type transport system permease protein